LRKRSLNLFVIWQTWLAGPPNLWRHLKISSA